jgi:hypothetical protein
MSTYSENESLFENVKWSNVWTLLNLVAQSTICTESLIERRYQEDATHFAATKNFLMQTQVLRVCAGHISVHPSLSADDHARRDAVLRHFVDLKESPVAGEMFRYLGAFDLASDAILRIADPSNPARHHAIRNFLMEMEVIRYRESERAYVLEPSYAWLFVLAHSKARPVRPGKLLVGMEANRDLGWTTEQAVVQWERNRLGGSHAHRVEHIAEFDVAAGFDVLSATIEGDEIRHRFIEVKAVSPHSLRFYWTHNEVEVARAVGPLYYLYLVPVEAGGVPVVDRMTIIKDPRLTVLDGDNWTTEANVLQCQLRRVASTEGTSDR